MLLGVLVASLAVAEPVPLTAVVVWTDETGKQGKLPFQGVADGTALRGRLGGRKVRLRVEGTIARDGSVTGAVMTSEGAALGTFGATYEAERLTGAYAVSGRGEGSWEAEADHLGALREP
jgi:hypothetical protein